MKTTRQYSKYSVKKIKNLSFMDFEINKKIDRYMKTFVFWTKIELSHAEVMFYQMIGNYLIKMTLHKI